jgi:hypothetical protein
LSNAVLVNGKEINDMETDELINYINGKPQNKNNHNKNFNKKKKKKNNKGKVQGEFRLIDQDNNRFLEALGNHIDNFEESTMSSSSYDHEQAPPKAEHLFDKEINEIDLNEFKKRIQSVHEVSKMFI